MEVVSSKPLDRRGARDVVLLELAFLKTLLSMLRD